MNEQNIEKNLRTALDALQAVTTPFIVVAGLPAAGKTTLARRIANQVGATVLDKDEVAAPWESAAMAQAANDAALRDGRLYREHVLPHTIAILGHAAQMLRNSGMPVVVDAPFLEQAAQSAQGEGDLAATIGRTLGTQPDLTIWMNVDAATQKRRFIARGFERDTPKLADFSTYRNSLRTVSDLPSELCGVRLG